MASARILLRGVYACPCIKESLGEIERDFRVKGLIPADKNLQTASRIAQGAYHTGVAASAGTHDGGGVWDISVQGWSEGQVEDVVKILRAHGVAAWYRTSNKASMGVEAEGFSSPHIHCVWNGCPHLTQIAANQLVAYKAGRNGLKGNAKDTGVNVCGRIVTWQQGLEAGLRKITRTTYRRKSSGLTAPKVSTKLTPGPVVLVCTTSKNWAALWDGTYILRKRLGANLTTANK
jgi:hypothetical protein